MSWVEIIADRKVRDAQDEGAFDNLPGKGKPLNLEIDPRVPPEQRAAYRLMREAQLLPDWIQIDKEIRTRLEQWEARIEQYARGRELDLQRLETSSAPQVKETIDRLRERFLVQAVKSLKEINHQIDRLNLIAPTPAQQKIRIDVEQRITVLDERFPRLLAPREVRPEWRELLDDKPTGAPRLGNRMPLRRRRDGL